MNEPAGFDPQYLSGIKCFNRREYFESHEVWESLWVAEHGQARRFLQGMIQAAVSLHHLGRGNRRGANKLRRRSRDYLTAYEPFYWGLDVTGFLAAVDACFDANPPGASPIVGELRMLPVIVLAAVPSPQSGGPAKIELE